MRIVFILTFLLTTQLWAQQPTSNAPNPTSKYIDVRSLFSDQYSSIPNINFYPNWNQATKVSELSIDQNVVLKYDQLNYQGIELGQNIDVRNMEFIHVDIWTTNATSLSIELISPGPKIASKSLTVNPDTWASYDISLREFGDAANLSEIFQLAFNDGGSGNSPTIYLDNLYFYRTETPDSADAYLTNVSIDGERLSQFDPNTFEYTVELPSNYEGIPQVSAEQSIQDASIQITQANSFPGQAIIETISIDSTLELQYKVNFEVALVPSESAPTPPQRNSDDVISIYSDFYTSRSGTNFNPNWGQQTQVSTYTLADDNLLVYDNFNYQGTQLSGSIDVSTMDYLHVDIWTPDAQTINLSIISPGPLETPVSLPVVNGTWRSYDIPLSDYSRVVNLKEIFQFKFDNAGRSDRPTIYIDNLYFYRGSQNLSNDASLKQIRVDEVPLSNFNPTKTVYRFELASNETEVPKVHAELSDTNASYTLDPADTLPGTTTITVTAEDGSTTQEYSIEFFTTEASSDASLSTLSVAGEEIPGFSPHILHYVFSIEEEASEVPELSVTTTNESASYQIRNASELPGSTTIQVSSADGSQKRVYSVFFKTEDLIWWDEFNGELLNPYFWSYDLGNGCEDGQNLCGWGNNELQIYTQEQVRLDSIPGESGNQALVITADSPSSGNFESGRIHTQNKVDLKYGMFEIRMKVPDLGNGLWPAVWFLGSNHETVGWPQSGEIDLMEMGHKAAFRSQQGFPSSTVNQFTSANIIWYANAACNDANPTCAAAIAGDVNYNQPYVSSDELFNRFQTYRMYWTANQIRLTVEDKGVERDLYTAPFPTTSSELRSAFNHPFNLIINLAVGGSFTDVSSASQLVADFPAHMYVDYVRLYRYNGSGEVSLNALPTASEQELVSEERPKGHALLQNYPNPFNPSTQISYEIDQAAEVSIRVVDVLGRTVALFNQPKQPAGIYHISFDAGHLSSGIYIYSLWVDGTPVASRKMTLIK